MFSLNSSPNCMKTISLASVQSSCAGMKKYQNHSPDIFPCHSYHNKNTNILWERSSGLTKCYAPSKETQNDKTIGFAPKRNATEQSRLFQSNSLVNVRKGGKGALLILFFSSSKSSKKLNFFISPVMLLIAYEMQ